MALGLAAIVAGCGAPSPAPEAPVTAAGEAPPTDLKPAPEPGADDLPAPSPYAPLPPAQLGPHIEDAQAELNRAEQAVNELLAPSPAPDPGTTPPRAPLPQPRPPRDIDRAPDTPPAVAASDRCSIACRALASMQSAATHLCALAGQTDARCQSARTRVENAQIRVRAQCPSCAEAQ
jgi:hypothetical protein